MGGRLAPLLPEQEHHLITVVLFQGGPETLAVQLRARDDIRQAKVCRGRHESIRREVAGAEVGDKVVCDTADGHTDGFPAQSSGTAVVTYHAGAKISTWTG